MDTRSLLVILMLALPVHSAPVTEVFTYQGDLQHNGQPADGSFDFEFDLYDAATDGLPLATTVNVDDVAVSGGVFSVDLDFGFGPFLGEQVWIEIRVREGASTNPHTPLAPRQPIRTVPYALHAEMVAMDAISSTEIANNSVTAIDLAANSVGPSELANNAVDAAAIAANAVASAEVLNDSLTSDDLAANSVGSSELANNAVDSGSIVNDSITAADLAANSVGPSELAVNAVDSAAIAPGAVGASDINTSQVQSRVSGTCGPGTYLAGIDADGSVDCEVLPVGLTRTLDRTGDVGVDTSVTVRVGGLPIISYFDETNDALKVYDCFDPACLSGTARTLDGYSRNYNSIALLRPSGFPVVSYFDGLGLSVYECFDAACSSGAARTLDAPGGSWTSIAVRSIGPIISHVANGNLKVFDCADVTCSSGIARTLDSAPSQIGYKDTSTAVRPGDLPIISYQDRTNNDLKVYDCTDPGCSSGTARTLADEGHSPSIAVRPGGLPIVSYVTTNDFLRVYDCADAGCATGTARILDNDVRADTSIAIRPGGLPIVSYFDGANDDLKVFDCADAACLSGTARTLDSAPSVVSAVGSGGSDSSIAVRPGGLPIISYYDRFNHDLKVYSCGDALCEN